jgi:hypothetical protein
VLRLFFVDDGQGNQLNNTQRRISNADFLRQPIFW